VTLEPIVKFSSEDSAKFESVFLKIGGEEGPKILVCGVVHVELNQLSQMEWRIEAYKVSIDQEMYREFGGLW
jgi:hypothetical protein